MHARRNAVAFVAAAIAAAGLVGMSAPRIGAALALYPHKSVAVQLRQGKLPSERAHLDLIDAYRQANRWHRWDGQQVAEAFAKIVGQARGIAGGQRRNSAMKEAEPILVAGLAQSPVDADGWRWLAVIRLDVRRSMKSSADALRMSQYTGPYARYLIVPRLRLSLQLWPQLESGDRELVYRQIRYGWSIGLGEDLVALAAQTTNPFPFRIALASRPDALVDFERSLRDLRRKTKQ